MLSDDELTRLLADVESDCVERKSSASNSDRLREAVCAFAIDLPRHRQPNHEMRAPGGHTRSGVQTTRLEHRTGSHQKRCSRRFSS